MEQLVEHLLGDYEQGKITRRHLIRAMAAAATVSAAAVSPVSGAQTGFRGLSLNHVTFRVSDIQRSSRFYQDLAGLRIREQKEHGQILAMDKSFLVLAETKAAPGVDHFCIAIANFDQKEVVGRLKQEGLDPQLNVRGEIYVRDPDGLRVQISGEDYAGQLP